MKLLHLAIVAVFVLATRGYAAKAESPAVPEWVRRDSWSEPPIRFRTVSSDLWATREEASHDGLARATRIARDFAAEANPRLRTGAPIESDVVHDHFVRDEFVEKVDWDYGPMYRAHLLLVLSPENRTVLLSRLHAAVLHRRLSQLGAGLAFVFLCLVTLLGYLRLDDLTRGYYTSWLLTGAITVVAGAGFALYSWLS
jgi:hypothetical protein